MAWLMQGARAGLHRQCLFGGLRIGLYDPVKAFYVKSLGVDPSKDAPFGLKVAAGLTTGALAISIASPTDLVKVPACCPSWVLHLAEVTETHGLLCAGTHADRGQAAARHAQKIPLSCGRVWHHHQVRVTHSFAAFLTETALPDPAPCREEGVAGLWRGLGPNVARNAIVNAAELASYDQACCLMPVSLLGVAGAAHMVPAGVQVKVALLSTGLFEDTTPCHLASGLGAGFFAVVCGSPVDVVKSRMMGALRAEPALLYSVSSCARGQAQLACLSAVP